MCRMTRGTRRAAAGGGGDPRTPLEFARQKRSDIERTGPSIGLGHGSGSWSRFAWTEADPPGFLEAIDILVDFMRANYIKKTASLSQDEKAGLWYEDLEDGPNVGWAVELAGNKAHIEYGILDEESDVKKLIFHSSHGWVGGTV